MELSYLREFIVLSQTLNFTRAAETLHLTQPTLSKHIVSMEKELNCSLLVRDKRSTELTEAGVVFATAAAQIVETFDEAKQNISDIQAYLPLKVNGVIYDAAVASITSIASTFLDAEGQMPIVYNIINDTNYLAELTDKVADILLANADLSTLEKLELDYIPLIRIPFVAMVNKNNPLATKKHVSMDDLRNSRFIKFADSYALTGWRNIEQVCLDHGYSPNTRVVLGRTHINYCSIPLGDEDVLILQSSMAQLRYMPDFSQVAILPVTDSDAVFRLYAIYRKEDYERVSPALNAYKRARQIILNHGKDGALVENDL